MKTQLKSLLFAAIFCYAPLRMQAQDKPNIILIYTDDMGYGDIGTFGGKFVPTPNLDRLATMGTKFTQYYTASPICSPSRVGVLTGMHPGRWYINTFLNTRKHNQQAGQMDYLSPQAPSIARMFKDAGYRTGHFGKWHMGGGRDVTDAPKFAEYGFDAHVSTYESPEADPLLTATDWIWSEKDSIKRWDRTKYFVDKTLAFFDENKGKPVYVNLWPDDMHTPWVPHVTTEYTGKFPMNPEQEMAFKLVLQEYDKQIGRLLDGLKQRGLDKNTIVIFTSDNGPLPSFKGSRAGGLRGTKMSLYEGGIRMPFIISWPARIAAGRTDSTSVLSSTDLLPSLLSMADIAKPANYKGDGEDRSKVLLGKSKSRKKELFWEYGRNDLVFYYPKGRDRSPNLAMRSGKWKLLMDYQKDNAQLFDIEADKYETKDVAAEHPRIVKKLKKKLQAWRTSLPVLSAAK